MMADDAPPSEYFSDSSGNEETLGQRKWEACREIGLGQLFLGLDSSRVVEQSMGGGGKWPTGKKGS